MAGKRLRIAVDCDEPLADCNTCLQAWHNREYGTHLAVDDIFSFKLWLVWGCSREEHIRRIHEFYESEDFRNMKPTPGAAEGVAAIAGENDLFVLTSRIGVAIAHTKPFIDRYYPGRFDKIAFANNYSMGGNGRSKDEICSIENADLLIDDCIHYALDNLKIDVPVILLDRPWNRERTMKEEGLEKLPSGIVRAGWNEIPELTDILKHDKKGFYKL